MASDEPKSDWGKEVFLNVKLANESALEWSAAVSETKNKLITDDATFLQETRAKISELEKERDKIAVEVTTIEQDVARLKAEREKKDGDIAGLREDQIAAKNFIEGSDLAIQKQRDRLRLVQAESEKSAADRNLTLDALRDGVNRFEKALGLQVIPLSEPFKGLKLTYSNIDTLNPPRQFHAYIKMTDSVAFEFVRSEPPLPGFTPGASLAATVKDLFFAFRQLVVDGDE